MITEGEEGKEGQKKTYDEKREENSMQGKKGIHTETREKAKRNVTRTRILGFF